LIKHCMVLFAEVILPAVRSMIIENLVCDES
jgi:hypothetical protein